MIRNISYNDKKIKDEIIAMVGRPYTLFESVRMEGTGSPRFIIADCSDEIQDILSLNTNFINYCNIELRPEGVIVGFRSLLETYAWVIPYFNLQVLANADHYEIQSNTNYMHIKNTHHSAVNKRFVNQLMRMKERYLLNSDNTCGKEHKCMTE